MLRALSFICYCISFTAIFTFSENVLGRLDQGFGRRESGTNFIEHFYWVLNVRANVSLTTFDAMACALACLRHSFCVSFNFAVNSGSTGLCELLREDKYTSSDRFEPSQFYHHYSMAVGKYNVRVVQKNTWKFRCRVAFTVFVYKIYNWKYSTNT